MNGYLLIALAVAAVLVDVAFAPGATLFGARPELTLVLIALWAALRPQSEVMLLAPTAGLALGLLGNEPLGASVLAFAPIVLAGGSRGDTSTERRFVFSIGLVAAGTPVYVLALAVLSRILGDPSPFGLGALPTLATLMLLNAVLAAVLYWPLARLTGDPAARTELRRY